MINNRKAALQKQQRRRALFFKEFSVMFQHLCLEEPALQSIFLTRLEISADKSKLEIFFGCEQGEQGFKQALEILTLYRGSLRKALGQKIQVRYVPQIVFLFDASFEKSQRIATLLAQIATEKTPESSDDTAS